MPLLCQGWRTREREEALEFKWGELGRGYWERGYGSHINCLHFHFCNQYKYTKANMHWYIENNDACVTMMSNQKEKMRSGLLWDLSSSNQKEKGCKTPPKKALATRPWKKGIQTHELVLKLGLVSCRPIGSGSCYVSLVSCRLMGAGFKVNLVDPPSLILRPKLGPRSNQKPRFNQH